MTEKIIIWLFKLIIDVARFYNGNKRWILAIKYANKDLWFRAIQYALDTYIRDEFLKQED